MSKVSFRIVYVRGQVIVFDLDAATYYLKTGPNYPELYDSGLVRQVVPNMDLWFLSNTQLEYPYGTVLHMAAAFADGARSSFSSQDMKGYVERFGKSFVKELFEQYKWFKYQEVYEIECLSHEECTRTVQLMAGSIATKRHELIGLLNRLWRLVCARYEGHIAVMQLFFSQLGVIPKDPEFPDSSEITEEITAHILRAKCPVPTKNVSEIVVQNVVKLGIQ